MAVLLAGLMLFAGCGEQDTPPAADGAGIAGVSGGRPAAASTTAPSAGTGHKGNTGSTGAPAAPASAPGSGPVVSGVLVTGVWQGTYFCSQGITGLSLRITGSAPEALAATFDFFPVPENPSVPRGSFTMEGAVRDGRIALDGREWVSRPSGYEMVNLIGTPRPGTPDSIDGGFRGLAGCTGFTVRRAPAAES
ncbi:hypothetical protein [Frankia sp. EI5c]|uniref:hypothetical protein n=1 Tax=Frankia sp. EI5c TaxID=683316 RepID=UPI0009FECB2D|nr:hypothetical protein [Frankia sp. EI5c]